MITFKILATSLLFPSLALAAAEPSMDTKRTEWGVGPTLLPLFQEKKPKHVELCLSISPELDRHQLLKDFFAECDHVESLYILGDRSFNDEDAKILAAAPFPNLKKLDVSQTQITNIGVETIANSTFYENLDSLDFSNTRMTHISCLPKNLKRLILAYTGVDDSDAKKIATLEHLETLVLVKTNISSQGLSTIASSKNMSTLTRLDLHDNPLLRDQGFVDVIKLPNMNQLTHLNLQGNILTEKTGDALTLEYRFPNLTELLLAGTSASINPKTAMNILSNHPKLEEITIPFENSEATDQFINYLKELSIYYFESLRRIAISEKKPDPDKQKMIMLSLKGMHLESIVDFWA